MYHNSHWYSVIYQNINLRNKIGGFYMLSKIYLYMASSSLILLVINYYNTELPAEGNPGGY